MSTSSLRQAAVTRDGSRIAVGGSDPRTRIWDLREGREAAAFYARADSLAFSQDGRFLAARQWDGGTEVFDVSEDGDMSVLRGHESYVYPVIFDHEGGRIWSGSWDGTARAWDAETHEPIVALQVEMKEGTNVLALTMSPDDRRIVGSDTSVALAWDTGTGRLLASSDEVGFVEWGSDGVLRGMAISTDSNEATPVERNRRLDPDTLGLLPPSGPIVHEGTPSPDGAWIALGSQKATLSIRSTREGGLVRTLERLPDKETVGLVTWSSDSARLVAAVGERLLAWDASSWRKIADEVAHAGSVHAVAFSPDSRLLASGGGDGVVRVHEAESIQPLLELRGHSAYVKSVAWSPDGTQLVSGSGDGTLRAWDSVPLRERWQAREERRRDMAALRPVVLEMFAREGDADRVLARVREKYPEGDASASRLRRAALDVALQASLERRATK